MKIWKTETGTGSKWKGVDKREFKSFAGGWRLFGRYSANLARRGELVAVLDCCCWFCGGLMLFDTVLTSLAEADVGAWLFCWFKLMVLMPPPIGLRILSWKLLPWYCYRCDSHMIIILCSLDGDLIDHEFIARVFFLWWVTTGSRGLTGWDFVRFWLLVYLQRWWLDCLFVVVELVASCALSWWWCCDWCVVW